MKIITLARNLKTLLNKYEWGATLKGEEMILVLKKINYLESKCQLLTTYSDTPCRDVIFHFLLNPNV
jgi:hypothetical protein